MDSSIDWIGLGWIGSNSGRIEYFPTLPLRVQWIGWVRRHMIIVDWFGLGQSASGLGWIRFIKMNQCPALGYGQLERSDTDISIVL